MKNPLIIFTVAVAALTLGGCDDDDRTELSREAGEAWNEARSETREALAEAKESSAEAWSRFSSFVDEKKRELKGEEALKEVDEEIGELREAVSRYTGDAKRKAEEGLAKLNDKRQNLGEQFAEAKGATGEAWEEAVEETREQWQDLKSYLSELRRDVREEMNE